MWFYRQPKITIQCLESFLLARPAIISHSYPEPYTVKYKLSLLSRLSKLSILLSILSFLTFKVANYQFKYKMYILSI